MAIRSLFAMCTLFAMPAVGCSDSAPGSDPSPETVFSQPGGETDTADSVALDTREPKENSTDTTSIRTRDRERLGSIDVHDEPEALSGGDTESGTVALPECPDDPISTCEVPPLLFVHGFLASGDTFARHAMLYQQNGFPSSALHVHDWNSFDQETDHTIDLDSHIDAILEASDCEQLFLMGHSAGGGLSVSYLKDEIRAAKVAKYIHIGSFALATLPSPTTPTLVAWSSADTIVPFNPATDLPACAVNGELLDQDHYAVATSEEAFVQAYTFLMGSAPLAKSLEPQPAPQNHGGRVVTLGSNDPVTAQLTVTPYDPITGQKAEPIWQGTSKDDGWFEGIAIPNPIPLVFDIDAEGQQPLRYYRESQASNNGLLYMRTLGGGEDTVSALLNFLLKPSPNSATFVIFSAHRALLAGKDSLTINGTEVLTEETASPDNTTISLFFQDTNGDGQDGGIDPALDAFPFFSGMDLFLPAGELATVQFNGRTIRVPLEASETAGIAILVLE